eukprot:GEMP01017915.1.p1 GENE.GEMP01017915.1~~GEMP01017915.1.p1  ORF type:complete len:476 (+),score=84.66 GEMP01017915.1:249-1676(+)
MKRVSKDAVGDGRNHEEDRHSKADGFVQKLIADESRERANVSKVAKHRFEQVVRSNRFNWGIGLAILANAVILGIETDVADPDAPVWLMLEIFFVLTFSFELGARLLVDGFGLFWDSIEQRVDLWSIFDAFLVLASFADLMFTVLGGGSESMDMVTTLRVCRLLRLARLVRLIRVFREMWLFVCGVFAALSTVFWAFMVIALIIFICSTFIVRTVGYAYAKDPESVDYDPNIAALFRNVPTAAMSLFQVITLDNWRKDIADPVMQKVPEMWIFFILFIGTCTYAIMSVIIAMITQEVIVAAQSNEQETRNQQERALRQAIIQIHEVFLEADVDGNGLLSKDEFYECLRNPKMINWLKQTDVSVVDAAEMFDIVDFDNSGCLTSNEFISGCLRARGPAMAKDILQLECDMWRYVGKLKDSVSLLEDKIDAQYVKMSRSLQQIDQKMLCIVRAVAMVNPTVSAWMSPLWDEKDETVA